MTLGTPNTLPNSKCKNILIKSSAFEKLPGVIVDNKLDFTEHLNTVCKQAKLKLHATNNQCLHRISFQLLPVGLNVLPPGDYS